MLGVRNIFDKLMEKYPVTSPMLQNSTWRDRFSADAKVVQDPFFEQGCVSVVEQGG